MDGVIRHYPRWGIVGESKCDSEVLFSDPRGKEREERNIIGVVFCRVFCNSHLGFLRGGIVKYISDVVWNLRNFI